MEFKCKDCKHSIFDETWGEYKCTFLVRRIYNAEATQDCSFYDKDPSKSKNQTKPEE